jgi:hypothetical protein
MQPVLVDGGELVPQAAVEIFDDPRVALHVRIPRLDVARSLDRRSGIAPDVAQNALPNKETFRPSRPDTVIEC